MLSAVLICPSEDSSREIEALLPAVSGLHIEKALSAYPSPDTLLRIIRLRKLNLVILSVDEFSRAADLITGIDSAIPGFPVITFGAAEPAEILPKLMHLGVRDHLSRPFQADQLAGAVNFAERRLKLHPLAAPRLSDLYAFFPAKPGVGTSTIAVSTSCALADNLSARTLLMDCDFESGAIQFLLKLGTSASTIDALSHTENLDEDLWSQMVGHSGALEVLHAGELNPPPAFEPDTLKRLLAMARAQYEVICVDLASSLDLFNIAMLREARKIFLVTTPELVSLHLANARMKRLTELGMRDQVNLLLNRKAPNRLSDDEVAKAVGLPVSYSFSNDYATVQGSILDAVPVPRDSDLGRNILNLAQTLAPNPEPRPVSRGRRFLEFFHVAHSNETQDLAWRD